MLKLTCVMTCEQCDEEIPAWIELESFGGDDPGLEDLFGSMFGSATKIPGYTIKGKPEDIKPWKNVTKGMKFTCSTKCYDAYVEIVKGKRDKLDEAHKWLKEIKKQQEINISGAELPEWFWSEFNSTEKNPLCQHTVAIDEPGTYRLRGGTKLNTLGYFTQKETGFWLWHEASDTSRTIELNEYSVFGRMISTKGKIEKGNLEA